RAPVCHAPTGPLRCSEKPAGLKLAALKQSGPLIGFSCASHSCQNGIPRGVLIEFVTLDVGCGLPHHKGVASPEKPDILFATSNICNPNYQVVSFQLGMVRQAALYTEFIRGSTQSLLLSTHHATVSLPRASHFSFSPKEK
ncbi:MAG: hypothetical protein ABW170_24365, partial [Candidatus Thiodiazotropha sp. L084R]